MKIMKNFLLQCDKCESTNCEIFMGNSEEISVICTDCGNLEEDV